jgi:hypothetical protein
MAEKLTEKAMSTQGQAYDNAELKHERMHYIMSLTEDVRDKTIAAMSGMSEDQQSVVWDRMRENETRQPQVQTQEPSM